MRICWHNEKEGTPLLEFWSKPQGLTWGEMLYFPQKWSRLLLMAIDLLGRMSDQSHSTQQPTRREAKDQRPPDSNPRPHRKKGVSIRTGQVSQLLWEVVWSPSELPENLCLYFMPIWNLLFAANFTPPKKEEEKQNNPKWLEAMVVYLSSL